VSGGSADMWAGGWPRSRGRKGPNPKPEIRAPKEGPATVRGYACGCRPTLRRGFLLAGRRFHWPFGLVRLACLARSRRRTSPIWPARFFSTCSLHTKRQGQSLFGHLSRRANCFRRSRTSRLSLTNSASSSVAARCLPFIMRTSRTYISLFSRACHLNPAGFAPTEPGPSEGPLSALESQIPPVNTARRSGSRMVSYGRSKLSFRRCLNETAAFPVRSLRVRLGFSCGAAQSSLIAPLFLSQCSASFAVLSWQQSCSFNLESMQTVNLPPARPNARSLARGYRSSHRA
jgi:hypothetical protein